MNTSPARFLTAQWRQLAMLNFEIDPAALRPLVPAGTELDDWHGRTFASVVGFLFLDARLRGIAIPFHRNFEEVNLRFYVRRKAGADWRRGVVFVRELVPRFAIAWVARWVYGENYAALPMQHHIGGPDDAGQRAVSYRWRYRGAENQITLTVAGDATAPSEESLEFFIAEHYWGYARRRDGGTTEYRVDHPPWRIAQSVSAQLTCDVAGLYGERFVDYLRRPTSAFLAEGSAVTVYQGERLTR